MIFKLTIHHILQDIDGRNTVKVKQIPLFSISILHDKIRLIMQKLMNDVVWSPDNIISNLKSVSCGMQCSGSVHVPAWSVIVRQAIVKLGVQD